MGELGLLHGIPRTATVRASQDSELLRIGGQDFLDALQAGRASRSLMSLASTRMARTPGCGRRPRPAGARHTRRRSAMNPDDRRRDRGVGRMTPSPSAAWLTAMPRLAMPPTGIDDAVTTREATP